MSKNIDINNLGTFASIAAVWAAYPEGGQEGDYLYIGSVKYRWNKYNLLWESAATYTESDARKLTELYADVTVNNDLHVGGTLYYHRMKGYDLGLFSSLTSLQAAYPSPEVGMWAFVVHPSISGKYQLYACSTAGTWTLSVSETTLDVLDFERYEEALALMQQLANGAQLSGYRAAEEVSDLPVTDVDPTLGWIVGNHLYVWVGEGGDVLDGKYKDCGELRGAKGDKGDKGNDGVVLDPEAVTIFDDMADLDGKTDEQKHGMLPDGNIIYSIENIIGTTTYDTKLISTDFETQGFYKIENNSLVPVSSENWLCKVVSVDTLLTTDAVGVASNWQSLVITNIPPIIYLSGSSPVWANYISCEYGTGSTGDGNFKQLTAIHIPTGATHAIINNLKTYGASAIVTYKYGSSIKDHVEKLENRFVFVDKNGNGDYTTIAAAINGTSDGDTIIVNSGIYEEDVHMWGETRHIVGVSRETCILTNGTGAYATPPLEANIGSIENMTIIADNYDPTILDPSQNQVLPGYGIHVEYANSTAFTLTIRNCKIVSKWCAAIGIGLRYNQTVIIDNCELISHCVRIYSSYAGHWVEMGGLFFHNDNISNNAGTGILRVSNSRLQGKKAALVMEAVNKIPLVDAEFDCNTFISEDYGVGTGIIYRYDNMVTQEGYLCGNKITLGIASHGNNIDELNA